MRAGGSFLKSFPGFVTLTRFIDFICLRFSVGIACISSIQQEWQCENRSKEASEWRLAEKSSSIPNQLVKNSDFTIFLPFSMCSESPGLFTFACFQVKFQSLDLQSRGVQV